MKERILAVVGRIDGGGLRCKQRGGIIRRMEVIFMGLSVKEKV